MGFELVAKHNNQDIQLYQQGEIQFIINAASNCQAEQHAATHGGGACAMGFRVQDVEKAYAHAIKQGAQTFKDCQHANHGLPAIKAIGGSVIYFVDATHQPLQKEMLTLHMLSDLEIF